MDAFAATADTYREQAEFLLVYTHEAHPSLDDWPDSPTTDARVERARLMQCYFAIQLPILVDPIETELADHCAIAQWGYVVLTESGRIEYLNNDATHESASLELQAHLAESQSFRR